MINPYRYPNEFALNSTIYVLYTLYYGHVFYRAHKQDRCSARKSRKAYSRRKKWENIEPATVPSRIYSDSPLKSWQKLKAFKSRHRPDTIRLMAYVTTLV